MARLLSLDPALPVLLRPDGAVQVGWNPRRAVLVRPPDGLTTTGLAEVLNGMRTPVGVGDLHRRASRQGLSDRSSFDQLLAALVDAGVVRSHPQRHPRRKSLPALSIRVHGCGPISELLISMLKCSGARLTHTSRANATAGADVDLVILADYLTNDPHLLRELRIAGVPHMAVRVRDGSGLVGPLVVPGVTSCLTCADMHRADRDSAWPALSAQLRDVIGNADRPTVLATAAVALSQIQRIIIAVRDEQHPGTPPATFDTTLEVDIHTNTITSRRWSRHPLCDCHDPAE